MTTRMLIDARHREETRVAVVKGNRIEELDFESAERKQLKGNIYLAKVTRVEPSLQAAFIDYGGNRHGFLAFSEIHPDYYQIPKEDREALLREEAEHAAEEAELRARHDAEEEEAEGDDPEYDSAEAGDDEDAEHDEPEELGDGDEESQPQGEGQRRGRSRSKGDQAVEALRERRSSLRRRYKIQDVIRRRQVLLVQVVKEERGNKGAALTTYLSLAGRYCVLMPNTSHGGGISRKISSAADRKRLKSIMADLALPPSMGCIVRTAGLQRTKTEIKRDFDYLARLWDGIRETTMTSSAPALIYGDSDLIKRAIRDIYNRDIDEVIVEGADGYRQAREFMKLLMPSHARRVKHYSDPVPLFQRAHVEDQLAAMYHPVVQLKSGGYLVINPTEALVSIDINSGRSTREHNIEQTATATNLEAAQEIARQLRLRDMAGLVVIDFIDMDNNSNVRKVEKAMKEALKNDRARIQVGRISSFGLMEMSRQRLRTGVLEASTRGCPHCEGTGLVRTASSAGVSALRLLEDEAARGRGSQLLLRTSQEAAFYVLNKKRADIAEIEDRYGVSVEVAADDALEGARMSVEAAGPPPAHAPRFDAPIEDLDDDLPVEAEDEEEFEVEAEAEEERAERPERAEGGDRASGDEGRRRRRRRRGRRGRRPGEEGFEGEAGEGGEAAGGDDEPSDIEAAEGAGEEAVYGDAEAGLDAEPRAHADAEPAGEPRRRRGRRGGRNRRPEAVELTAGEAGTEDTQEAEAGALPIEAGDVALADAAAAEPAPIEPAEAQPADASEPVETPKRTRRRPRARAAEAVEVVAAPAEDAVEQPAEPTAEVVEAPAPRRSRRAKPAADAPVEGAAVEAEAPKRRTRRKAAELMAEAANETVAAPEATPVAEAAPEAPVAVADERAADVAEPVAPDAADASAEAGAEGAEAGEGAAPRRGWWQRTFGA